MLDRPSRAFAGLTKDYGDGDGDGDGDDDYQEDLERFQTLYNITRLSPEFWIGGRIVSRAMAKTLGDLGVTHILCVADGCVDEDQKRAKQADAKLFCVHWHNHVDEPIKPAGDFDAAYCWLMGEYGKAILHDRCLPHLYVHCEAGIHRAPAMMSYLIARLSECDVDSALDYIYARRPWTETRQQAPGLVVSARRALAASRGERNPDGSPIT